MINNRRIQPFGWVFRLLRLLIAGALFMVSQVPSGALAQTSDDPWTVPLNLSRSGVTASPTIVIDSDALVHAVWQDDLSNVIYTRLDGDQWMPAKMTDLNRLFRIPLASEAQFRPQLALYAGPNPLFIPGPGPFIFAFWISAQGRLFTSKVTNQNFEYLTAWDPGGVIASDVASFTVTVDAHGEWHLAFLRTVDEPDDPAGIYYARSTNNGWNWGTPRLLYASAYLRGTGVGEANLSIVTSGTEDTMRVYVAWDNRPRKQVLLTQSGDAGRNWEPPTLIAGPAPGSGLAGPFNIQVGADKDSVVLVWQNGEPDGVCTQFYRSSINAGAIWSEPKRMLDELAECPNSNDFVAGLVNSPSPRVPPRLYLLTKTERQVFLTAWNGLQWSEPQVQPTLASFEDPELYTEVSLGCINGSLVEERIYIVGCDQGVGGDVWVTSRDLESTASWFLPSVWSPLSPIGDENLEIEAVELVATGDDLIHAFFNQRQSPAINYTYWDGDVWSPIAPVLELPDGAAGRPAIAAGPGNELLLFVPNEGGGLFFSRATSGNAGTASLWSAPTQPGIGHDGEIGSVDVALNAAGTIYLAYSVPVNEERGIYLVQSSDHGATWSEPLQVFDGTAAGFDLVGAPSLLNSADGSLHIIWKEQAIRGDGAPHPLALYYTRSEDGGRTFNEPEVVVEEPADWREIATDGKGNLHLLWQPQGAGTAVWDQVSVDGGNSWQYPLGLPDEGRLAAVTRDPAGMLHFVSVGPGALGHMSWDESRWQAEASLGWTLSPEQESEMDILAAAVNMQGKLVVILAAPPEGGDATEKMLLYSTRTLELPSGRTATQAVPTEILSPSTPPATTSTPVGILTPTMTIDEGPADLEGQGESNAANRSASPFASALLPVALLLLSVLGIVIWRAASARNR
jgi:hypothetical protein